LAISSTSRSTEPEAVGARKLILSFTSAYPATCTQPSRVFSIFMITAYATLKKAAAIANHDGKRLDDQRYKLIVQVATKFWLASTTTCFRCTSG
jgi:fumarate hydratase class II